MDLNAALPWLGNLSAKEFMNEYWQKKPLLVRKAFDHLDTLIDANTLAGLALEEHIESRIIQLDRSNAINPSDAWSLELGPFTETQLQQRDDKDWTLLVQGVNQHLTDWHLFLQHFNCFPNWRLDDIMLSYATDGGSVGPHFDNYDVFLIQVSGNRRWLLGPTVDEQTPLLPHKDLRLLADMEVNADYVLEPGDLLYVPPSIPHHGIAAGECITASVGFRAPDMSNIIREFSEHVIENTLACDTIADADYQGQEQAGWINREKIKQIQSQMLLALSDTDVFERWFTEAMTASNASDTIDDKTPEKQGVNIHHLEALDTNEYCLRDEEAQLAYTGENENQPTALYVNGEYQALPPQAEAFVQLLCAQRCMNTTTLKRTLKNKDSEALFCKLCEQNVLYFPDQE